MKYRHCDGKLVLKVTDDRVVRYPFRPLTLNFTSKNLTLVKHLRNLIYAHLLKILKSFTTSSSIHILGFPSSDDDSYKFICLGSRVKCQSAIQHLQSYKSEALFHLKWGFSTCSLQAGNPKSLSSILIFLDSWRFPVCHKHVKLLSVSFPYGLCMSLEMVVYFCSSLLQCLKFKTDQAQDLRKMEKLNNTFFSMMARGPDGMLNNTSSSFLPLCHVKSMWAKYLSDFLYLIAPWEETVFRSSLDSCC